MASGREGPSAAAPADDSVYVFRFLPANGMFYIPLKGNDVLLQDLCRLVESRRAAIEAGETPVRVESYCASLPTEKGNLDTAFVRASRVKSELIIREGLKEADFVTTTYARAYFNDKDAVVVTVRVPAGPSATPADTDIADNAKDLAPQGAPSTDTSVTPPDTSVILSNAKDLKPQGTSSADTSVILSETKDLRPQDTPSADTSVILSETKDLKPRSAEHEIDFVEPFGVLRSAQNDNGTVASPYCFALRTNLLYDAMLPTLGVEWRATDRWGVRLDGSLSRWSGNGDKVQKIWLVNPEVRRYLLHDRKLYAGVFANFGQYNIYKYPIGSLFSSDTGYQGKLWGMGLSVGYQLSLPHNLALDFNLGLGYTRSEYDSFTMTDGVRVYKQRDRKKNLWGPTQAGVSLVWRLKAKS